MRKNIRFLQKGYRSIFSSPDTFFKNVDYLNSGTNLIIDKNFKFKFKTFWKKKCLRSQVK